MSFKLMAEVFDVKVGSPIRKMVLLKLADQANDNGECYPSYETIANACELSRRSVITHIKWLEDNGYLWIEHRYNHEAKKNFSNMYHLTLSKGSHDRKNIVSGAGFSLGGGAGAALGSEGAALGGSAGAAPEPINIEPINEPIKDLCDLEKTAHGDDVEKHPDNASTNSFLNQSQNDEAMVKKDTKRGSALTKSPNIPFDEFWSMYDKKQDRAKCEKKWLKLTDEERLLTMNHLPAYIQSTPNKQYRKHPSTYLNGEAWNNEVISNLPVTTNNQGYNYGQQQSASQPTTDAESYMDSLRGYIPATTALRDVN